MGENTTDRESFFVLPEMKEEEFLEFIDQQWPEKCMYVYCTFLLPSSVAIMYVKDFKNLQLAHAFAVSNYVNEVQKTRLFFRSAGVVEEAKDLSVYLKS